jgi:hypothetical protein
MGALAGVSNGVSAAAQLSARAFGFAVAAVAPALAAERFTYADIGLQTTLAEARQRFPGSRVEGHYIHVSDRDHRGQVSDVELADPGQPRRVRLSFQRPRDPAGRGQPVFPKCKAIEPDLRARYGAPDEVRKFAAEAQLRADRLWKGAQETLTLPCFAGPSGELLAEAVVIAER